MEYVSATSVMRDHELAWTKLDVEWGLALDMQLAATRSLPACAYTRLQQCIWCPNGPARQVSSLTSPGLESRARLETYSASLTGVRRPATFLEPPSQLYQDVKANWFRLEKDT
jgi:hypothetical protein